MAQFPICPNRRRFARRKDSPRNPSPHESFAPPPSSRQRGSIRSALWPRRGLRRTRPWNFIHSSARPTAEGGSRHRASGPEGRNRPHRIPDRPPRAAISGAQSERDVARRSTTETSRSTESNAIMQYLAEKAGDDAFFPRDAPGARRHRPLAVLGDRPLQPGVRDARFRDLRQAAPRHRPSRTATWCEERRRASSGSRRFWRRT